MQDNLETLVKMFAWYVTTSEEGARYEKEQFAGKDIYYFKGGGPSDFFFCLANGRSLLSDSLMEMKSALTAADNKRTLAHLEDIENIRRTGNLLVYVNFARLAEDFDAVEQFLRQRGLVEQTLPRDELDEIRETASAFAFAALNARMEDNVLDCEYAVDMR
jgi:hypothetical protein